MQRNYNQCRDDMEQDIKSKVIGYVKPLVNEVYNRGWHDGRRYEREKLKDSGYLIIDPDKKEYAESFISKSPCEGCELKTGMLKIGCTGDVKTCKKYQDYLLLLEIFDHFDKKE